MKKGKAVANTEAIHASVSGVTVTVTTAPKRLCAVAIVEAAGKSGSSGFDTRTTDRGRHH
jgi:hypothetical protein